jgi:O-methyltransferase
MQSINQIRYYMMDRFSYFFFKIALYACLKNKYMRHSQISKPIWKKQIIWLSSNEVSQLIDAVQAVETVEGDIAEVGVCEGSSAKVISQIKGPKSLHLFDTFDGLPDISTHDLWFFKKGAYASRKKLSQLEAEFSAFENVYFYAGVFPRETGYNVQYKKFSFVHLDADIYNSTLESLDFFYPRMSAGGIILGHDYLVSRGVRKAFDEFFEDRLEPVIPIVGSYCLIVKI